jgi:hypothetical protein
MRLPLERLPDHNTRRRDCERATGARIRPTTAVSALAACGALCPLKPRSAASATFGAPGAPESAQRPMTIILGFA